MEWHNYPDLYDCLIEWETKHYTQELMAKRLSAEFPELFPTPPTRNAVKNALATAKERTSYLEDLPVAVPTPYLDKYQSYLNGDDVVAKDSSLLSSIMEKSNRKIFVLSDLHIPFMDEEKFQEAVDLNRTADLCVIAGDILDGYSLSRWRKEQDIPFQHECDQTLRVFEYLSKVFKYVIVIHGNHDDRAMKTIRDHLPPSLLFLVDRDPLTLMTSPFPNIKYLDSWYVQIGDCLIAHQERSSSYEGRPPVLLGDYFETKGWARRLKLGEIRLYITAHTHQTSSVYKEDRKYMETGTLAKIMDYTLDSKAFMRPPINACISVVQHDGKSVFNECREWIL